MKIMIYEMSRGGGLGNYSKNLANGLSNILGVQNVYLNTVRTGKISGKSYGNLKLIENLKPLSEAIDKKKKIYWLLNRGFVTVYNAVKRHTNVIKIKPDIININQIIPIIDQFFIKFLKRRTCVIITVHDVIPPQKSYNWSLKSLGRLYQSADYLIAHSDENKRTLINLFNIDEKRIYVVEHGVEPDNSNISSYESLYRLKISKENKKILLFFGSIRESKGLEILIEALKDLDDCILLIAGSVHHGESFDKYEELLTRYRVNAIVHNHYIEDAEIPLYFKACDIVVLPYKEFSSQSGVLMQAVTYKKAVIATDVSGFRSFIEKYDVGKVVKPNNVTDLRNAIIDLISDDRQIEKYADNMEKAYNEMNWESICNKHVSLYQHIIEERKR